MNVDKCLRKVVLTKTSPDDLSALARKNWFRIEMQIRTKRIDDWKDLFLECIEQMYFLIDEKFDGT